MRRLQSLRALELAVVGLVALSIGARPALRAQIADPAVASAAVGGAFGGGAEDEDVTKPLTVVQPASPPMSLAATRVWLKMQEKLTLSFPDDTPLEDIIKYIKKATEDEDDFPKGIPIYWDPVGLRNADRGAASPISIDLEGIPLAASLKLALTQLDLGYYLHEDGILVITDLIKIRETNPNAMILEELAALRAEVRALREEAGARRRPAGLPEDKRNHRSPGGMSGGMGGTGGMM